VRQRLRHRSGCHRHSGRPSSSRFNVAAPDADSAELHLDTLDGVTIERVTFRVTRSEALPGALDIDNPPGRPDLSAKIDITLRPLWLQGETLRRSQSRYTGAASSRCHRRAVGRVRGSALEPRRELIRMGYFESDYSAPASWRCRSTGDRPSSPSRDIAIPQTVIRVCPRSWCRCLRRLFATSTRWHDSAP